jgi:iron complex outermembrane recepter protein
MKPKFFSHLSPRPSLSTGALIIMAALGPALLSLPTHVRAQTTQADATRSYTIAPGPLQQALDAFTQQSGVNIEIDRALTQGKRSVGLTGSYSPQAALQALLAGTGLQAVAQGSGFAVRVDANTTPNATASTPTAETGTAVPLQQVTVTGYRTGRVVGSSKTDASALDTAQNVQTFTRQRMEEQGARDINDVVRNSPAVGFSDPYGLTIRGFAANNVAPQGGALRQDGLSGSVGGTGATQTLANVETVEILKGPNSVLYGAGADGGLINLITKKPKGTPEHSVQGELGSRDLVRVLADSTGPIDAAGSLRYRLVAEATRGGLRFTEFEGLSNRDVFIAPSLEFVGERNNFLLQAEYRDKRNTPSTYWGAYQAVQNNRPEAQFSQRYLGSNSDFDDNRGHAITAKWTYTFDGGHTLNAVMRRSAYAERYVAHPTVGRFLEGSEGRLAERFYYDAINDVTEWSGSVYGTFTLDAGVGGKHNIMLGTDIKRNRTGSNSIFLYGGSAEGIPPIDIFAPDYSQRTIADETLRNSFTARVATDRAYIQDTVRFGEQWITSLGLAYDRFSEETDFSDETPINVSKATKRFGLVYKPTPSQAVFGGYSESFIPQQAFFNQPEFGGPFKPEQGKSTELGWQWESANKRLGLSASVYRIEKTNVLDRQGEDELYTPNTVRSQGLELEANGQITPQWSLQAGYAYNDAKVTDSVNTGVIGKRQSGTQRHKINIWTRYNLATLPSLGLGGGMTLVRDLAPDPFDPAAKLPGFTVFDAALFYNIGAWQLSAEVKNLFDKIYAFGQTSSGDFLIGEYGLRRTVRVNARFNF